MIRDQESYGYYQYKPTEKGQLMFSYGDLINIKSKSEFADDKKEVVKYTSSDCTAAAIFLFSILNLGMQYLQIKYLQSQLSDPDNHIEHFVSNFVVGGFIIKTILSIVGVSSSAFYEHKDYYVKFSLAATIFAVVSLGYNAAELYYSSQWLNAYTGIDFVYIWLVIFMTAGELIILVPLSITLIFFN